MNRRQGGLTYRLVQVITGHGCFGEYLHRVARRESTTVCHHCEDENRDIAQHTLEFCPAWTEQRGALASEIGSDLSLPTIVQKMVGSKDSWKAVVSFCEQVVLQKETAERVREADPASDPARRKRPGRARRNYSRQQL